MNAACVMCGGFRDRYDQVCPACGHRPEGEGLLVAWLLSTENLDEEALQRAAAKVQDGEALRPSARMLDRARRALGSHLASDPGLTAGQLLALLTTNLLVTPLVGWVLFFWWRETHPRAAWQSLALALPASVLLTVGFLWLYSVAVPG